jgi:PAS domain S-box-containing protein
MAKESRTERMEAVSQEFARVLRERQDEFIDRFTGQIVSVVGGAYSQVSFAEMRPRAAAGFEAFRRSLTEDPDSYADFWAAASRGRIREGYGIKDIQEVMSIAHRVISEIIAETYADDPEAMLALTIQDDDILDRARVKLGEVYAAIYEEVLAERKQAEEELEGRVKQLTGLNQLSQAVTASLEMEQVLGGIVSLIGEIAYSDYTTAVMVDEEGRLIHGAEILPDVPRLEQRARPEGHTNWIIRTRQAVIVNDVAEDGAIISQTSEEAPPTLNPQIMKAGIKSLAGLPLIAKGRLLGVLYLHSPRPYHFHGQLPLLSTYANQAAIAIENARLFEETRKRAGQLQTAAEVSRAASSILDPDELLRQAVDLIQRRFDLYYSGIFLVDEAGQYAVLRAGTGEAGRKMLERGHRLEVGGESMIGWCVANAQARIALDVGQEAVRFENPLLPDTRSEMALPLISRGRVIGAVTVQSSEEAAFSAEDITVLQSVADQLANAIENAHLLETTQTRLEQVILLSEISAAASSSLDLITVLADIARRMTDFFEVEHCGIVVREPGGERMYVAAEYPDRGTVDIEVATTGYPLAELVMQKGQILAIEDPQNDPRMGPEQEWARDLDVQSALFIPLIAQEQVIGSIGLDVVGQPRHFSEVEIAVAQTVAAQISMAVQNTRLFASVESQVEERTAELTKANEQLQREIAERKQTEEALTQERSLLRTLIDSLPDYVYFKDAEGRFIIGNAAVARLMGTATPDELIGKTDFDFYPRELAAQFYADEQEIIQSGQPLIDQEGPSENQTTGDEIWISNTKVPLRDGQGEIVGLVGVTRDITERKQAETELRAAHQRLLDIIDFLPDATFVIDQEKKVIAWNRAIEEMTGVRKEDIIGQGDYAYAIPFYGERRPLLIDLIGAEDPEEIEALYDVVERRGDTLYSEIYLPTIYGGVGGHVWFIASPLLDEEGNRYGAIESIRDITGRRQAEEALRESEERFRDVALSISDWVWEVDANGVYTFCSEKVEDVLGCLPDEIIGKTPFDLMPPDEAERIGEVFGEIVAGKKPIEDLENWNVRKDGQLVCLLTNGVPMLDEEGNLIGYRGVDKDITEQKRLQEEREQLYERRTWQVQTSTDVAQEVAAAPALDELFRRVVTLVKERFGYYHAQVFRADPETGDLLLAEGYGEAGRAMKAAGHKIGFGRGVVGTAASGRQPVLVPDVSKSPDWLPNPHLPETKGELAVPVMLRDRVLGVLDVQSERAGYLSEEDQILLLGLCGQIASAIESTRLLEETKIFRQFAEASGQGLAIATLEGEIVYVNPTICRLYEVAGPEDMIGEPIILYHPEEIVQRMQDEFIPVVMQEGQWVGESLALSAKGRIIPVIQNLFLICDDKGHPLYLATVLTDISERKRAEAEMETTLRELGTLYRRYSREEWEKFLETGAKRHGGYIYDQTRVSPAGDFWSPEIGLAVNRKQPATSQDAAEVVPVEAEAPASLVAPLLLRGEVIGAMGLRGGDGEKEWSPDDIALIEAIASQVALAVENARLFEQTQEALEETAELYRASRRLSTAGSLGEILTAIVESLDIPDISSAVVFIHEAELGGGEYMAVAARWPSGGREPMPVGVRLSLKEFPAMANMLDGEPIWIADVESDERLGEPARAALLRERARSAASIPLFVHGVLRGLVTLGAEVPHTFAERERRLAMTLTDQAAIAIENQRLFEQAQIEARQSRALYEASQIAGRLEAGFEAAMESLFGAVRETADFDQWWVALLDESGEMLQGIAGYCPGLPPESIKSRRPVGDQHDPMTIVTTSGEPLVVNQPPTLPDELPSYVSEEMRRTVISKTKNIYMPVMSGERILGVMLLGRDVGKPDLTERDVELARALANQVAVAAENRRLFAETERRARQLATAADVSRAAASILELDSLLFEVTDLIRERFDFYHASIFLLDGEGEYAELRESTGEVGRIMKERGHRLLVGGPSIIGWVTANRRPRVALDVGEDPIHFRNELLPDTRSELAIPLISGDRLLGALDVQSTEPNAFGEDDVRVLQILADQVAVAIENAQAYKAQQEAAERTREADRLKSQFLANMSHELRTPLNSVIGFSRVILRGIDGPLTELQQQDLTAIYNSGQHLLGLINDILDLSKIEAGKMDLTFEEVDLKEVCRGVMSTAIALVKDKPIELRQDIDPNLPIVQADGQRIRQVILNFLSNAAKFTEKGHISLRAYRQDDDVVISVTDTGIGISEEHKEKIFKEFEQVDASPTRRAGGTGLGLAISRHFIEMHGGEIWSDSQVGAGSTFYFSLPIHREAEAVAEREREEIDYSRRLILAVDDDPGVITLFKRYLEKQGYQVLGVGRAGEVIPLAEELSPYAITLDILMPDKDGWEVIQELKRNRRTRTIPVIICSITGERGKGFTLGAADYLVKPIMENELLEALNRVDGIKENKRVVIVDDQPADVRLIRRILEAQTNFRVFEAQGGQEGIKIIKREQPDLIILDLMMPEVDGFAVLEAVKADPATRSIPIIVITAKELSDEDRRVLNGQIEVLLQKGLLDEEELLQNLAQALELIGAEGN